MIRKVVLRNFKRFGEVTFDLPGHVVLAGPNNTGKTTLLQAIAAWELGFRKWRELNNYNPRRYGYSWQELERLAFSAVAVRSFDMLWQNRRRHEPFEIGIQVDGLPMVTLEFRFHSAGSIEVRPKADIPGNVLQDPRLSFQTTFIPAMSGLSRAEAQLAHQDAIDSALAQGRPGEVLRNLLFIAHRDDTGWRRLNTTMERLFSCRLEAPKSGAELVCEYRQGLDESAPKFDVASAGSGFLQVLLLLTLLVTQSHHSNGTHRILLIDEPDAHLHLLLQRSIYSELRQMVVGSEAQLFVATHSEMIVNNVDSRELYLMFGTPRLVSDEVRRVMGNALGAITHSELLEADGACGVLYTEDFTDVDILKAFAKVLGDESALRLLSRELVVKSTQAPLPDGLGEFSAQQHWAMLKLVRQDLSALEILDGDSRNRADDRITGTPEHMQRLRWKRYEIENYLIHPRALQKYIEARLGGKEFATLNWAAAEDLIRRELQDDFLLDPSVGSPLVESYFQGQKTSEEKSGNSLSGLIPRILRAAGIEAPKREFFEIATHFLPEEVHPEIVERLNQIKQAFGVAHV